MPAEGFIEAIEVLADNIGVPNTQLRGIKQAADAQPEGTRSVFMVQQLAALAKQLLDRAETQGRLMRQSEAQLKLVKQQADKDKAAAVQKAEELQARIDQLTDANLELTKELTSLARAALAAGGGSAFTAGPSMAPSAAVRPTPATPTSSSSGGVTAGLTPQPSGANPQQSAADTQPPATAQPSAAAMGSGATRQETEYKAKDLHTLLGDLNDDRSAADWLSEARALLDGSIIFKDPQQVVKVLRGLVKQKKGKTISGLSSAKFKTPEDLLDHLEIVFRPQPEPYSMELHQLEHDCSYSVLWSRVEKLRNQFHIPPPTSLGDLYAEAYRFRDGTQLMDKAQQIQTRLRSEGQQPTATLVFEQACTAMDLAAKHDKKKEETWKKQQLQQTPPQQLGMQGYPGQRYPPGPGRGPGKQQQQQQEEHWWHRQQSQAQPPPPSGGGRGGGGKPFAGERALPPGAPNLFGVSFQPMGNAATLTGVAVTAADFADLQLQPPLISLAGSQLPPAAKASVISSSSSTGSSSGGGSTPSSGSSPAQEPPQLQANKGGRPRRVMPPNPEPVVADPAPAPAAAAPAGRPTSVAAPDPDHLFKRILAVPFMVSGGELAAAYQHPLLKQFLGALAAIAAHISHQQDPLDALSMQVAPPSEATTTVSSAGPGQVNNSSSSSSGSGKGGSSSVGGMAQAKPSQPQLMWRRAGSSITQPPKPVPDQPYKAALEDRSVAVGASMPYLLVTLPNGQTAGWGGDSGSGVSLGGRERVEADLPALMGPNTTVEYVQPLHIGTFKPGATITCEMVVRRAAVPIGDGIYEMDIFAVSGVAQLGYVIGLNDMIRLGMVLDPAASLIRMPLPTNRKWLKPGAVVPPRPYWCRGPWVPMQTVPMYWKTFGVRLHKANTLKQADYVSVWSAPVAADLLDVLDNPGLHGTPLQDFLSSASAGGWQSGHYTAQPCNDLNACNAFSHYPLWHEEHADSWVPEGYVEVQACAAAPSSEPAQVTPDLIAVKLKPCTEHLTPEQVEQLTALCCEFADVFSVGSEVGEFPSELVPPLAIDTKPDAVPCKQKPYRNSRYEEDWLRTEVDKLVQDGIVRKNTRADWVSPVVIVKSGGKLRLCINFQRLNAATVADSYPMPRVEDVVNSMAGSEFFTHLDVRRGFWHLPIAPADCAKTTFATPWGEQYEFTRCPFGLVNAPAAYQRAMDTAFSGVEGCKVYMDDTYVHGQGWQQHIASLRAVFERCRQYNIKLNWDKCCFAAPRIRCLGYIVDAGGVTVDAEKVAAINQLPAPRNAQGVKSFLGMAGYFRHFIDKFAERSAPLTYLTRKSVRFVWTAECQQAFDDIKQALISAPCLRLPDWSRPFILHIDWSKVAVGCYLSQQDEDGVEYPVAFASRLLTPTEQRYAPLEGECLALVWAVHKYRYYLHGRPFTVYTDHKSLEWLQKTRFDNSKVERWALRLQEFDFTIVYKPGEKNVVADCLSRACAAQLLPPEGSSTPGLSAAALATWPTQASQQKEIDAVQCSVCEHAGGWDNMAICHKCQQCYHLRCLVPPMTTVPSGDWFCPACDPVFRHGLQELCRDDTPLSYAAGDPYTRPEVLAYLQTGVLPEVPVGADKAAAARLLAGLRHLAAAIKPHPSVPGWLMVRRRLQPGPTWLCCPPVEYRWDVMRLYHDALGHCGSRQLMTILHRYFHWRGMKADVEGFTKVCDACQRRKLALPELPDLQEPARHPGPFRHLHVDLAGPFPTPLVSVHGQILQPQPREEVPKAYVVLVVDYFTKAAEFVVVHNKTAAAVAAAVFNGWICRYGVPEYVTSDNGKEFTADFLHMLARLGVKHIAISPHHPAANGAVERLVRSFKDIISKAVNNHPEHWVRMMPHMRMAYMSRVHSAVGASPFEMLHGVEPRLATAVQIPGAVSAAGQLPADAELYLQYMVDKFAALDLRALKGIQQQFQANKKAWQRRKQDFMRKGDHNLAVGNLVLVMEDKPDTALSQAVHGPYQITGFVQNGAVAVLETGTTTLKPDKQCFHRHVSVLARYYDEQSVFGRCCG